MDRSAAEAVDSRRNWLYLVGGAAALVILVLFLIGTIGLVAAGPQPAGASSWLKPWQDNWLIVLFKLNAGWAGVQPERLSVADPLDIVIMALFGAMSLALCAALWRVSRLWSAVAASLPFLGIPVFLITSMAGRSGLLVGGLIISIVMLKSHAFSRACAGVGIAGSALLFFAGDLGTTIFSSSSIIAILTGIGYVLWMVWLLLIARSLLQLGTLTRRISRSHGGDEGL